MPLPLNTLMTARGEFFGVRFDPFMGYNFLIEIDMLITGGFTQVQGLDSQIELVLNSEDNPSVRQSRHWIS